MEFIQKMLERREQLITEVTFGNLDDRQKRLHLQEINRITKTLGQA